MKKILFTGGGSAGHVIPNLALIDEFLSGGQADVCYIGTNGIEKELVSTRKIPYFEIQCPKLNRGGGFLATLKNVKIPLEFYRAVQRAKVGLKTFQPDLVFSKGGFVALPVVYAARRLKIPCFTHESDLSPGLANRLMAKKCQTVFTAFPETAKAFKNGQYVGAPLRRSVWNTNENLAKQHYSIADNEKVLLVLCGGSGSTTINQAVRSRLKELTAFCTVLHICGKGNVVESNIKRYIQREFIHDVGEAYACADLVLSRAGAGALFEIMALKKPALFVPLAKASRGDQIENAEYFRKKGLCYVLQENDLNQLIPTIKRAFSDETLRERLRAYQPSNGTENILAELSRRL